MQDIGQQKRNLVQGALDEAYYKFLKEEAYPQDILASYSGTTYGSAPFVSPGRSGTRTETGPQPYQQSPGQQLLGLGMAGLNMYGKGTGGFQNDFSWATMFKKEGGGLSDLPVVRRQSSGRLARHQLGGYRAVPTEAEGDIVTGPEGETLTIDMLEKILAGQAAKRPSKIPPLDSGPKGLGTYKPPAKPAPSVDKLSATEKRTPAKLTENKLAQAKDAPRTLADNKTLMERLTQRGVKMLEEEVPSAQTLERLKIEKAKEPSLNVELQRQRGEDLAAEKAALNKALTAERTAIQEEGYAEESKAMTDYLNKNKKLIDELGGYPGDIIGDAIDQGMDQRGIVRMLTKTLNVTAKGLGSLAFSIFSLSNVCAEGTSSSSIFTPRCVNLSINVLLSARVLGASLACANLFSVSLAGVLFSVADSLSTDGAGLAGGL